MLTPETIQGGQGAVPCSGCNTPLSRLVLPPWFPNQPLSNRASWSGVCSANATGYEFAGHVWSEQRGTALERIQTVETVSSSPGLIMSLRPHQFRLLKMFAGREWRRRGHQARRARFRHFEAQPPKGLRRGVPLHPRLLQRRSRWSPQKPGAKESLHHRFWPLTTISPYEHGHDGFWVISRVFRQLRTGPRFAPPRGGHRQKRRCH